MADISPEGGQKTAAQNPENLVFEKMDVTKAEDWSRVVERAFSQFGRLDVLVNNAGVTYRNKVPFLFILLLFYLASADVCSRRWKSPRRSGNGCLT